MPDREPQEYSRNMIGAPYIQIYSCYFLGVPCLGFPSPFSMRDTWDL